MAKSPLRSPVLSRKTALVATALAVGILTLGVEIVAGRLLAPYFGSSLHQWAALIGVALLSYMAGYAFYAGLNRWGPAVPLAAGGLYVLLLPAWLFGGLDRTLAWPIWLASTAGALLSIGVPSALWASLLPFLQDAAGERRASRVLAWSAAGNLAGAWGIAFVGVPWLGTRYTLALLGASAVVLAALWGRPPAGRRSGGRLLVLALLVGLSVAALASSIARKGRSDGSPWARVHYGFGADALLEQRSKEVVEVRDTAYQHLAVWDEGEGAARRRALAMNDALQFLWSEREKLTSGPRYEYYNYSTAAAAWTGGAPARSALILGLGGGLVPFQLRQFYPGIRITSFELDAGVADFARRLLPLAKAGPVNVRVGDGRILLRNDPAKYDYILLDTFLNSYVPFHLTTREFFELVRARLNPGGVLLANFHTVFETSGLLPRLENTIRSVFPSVARFRLPAGTTFVLATPEVVPLRERLETSARSAPQGIRELCLSAAAGLQPVASPEDAGGEILTDDRNDTEQRLYETRRHVVVAHPL